MINQGGVQCDEEYTQLLVRASTSGGAPVELRAWMHTLVFIGSVAEEQVVVNLMHGGGQSGHPKPHTCSVASIIQRA